MNKPTVEMEMTEVAGEMLPLEPTLPDPDHALVTVGEARQEVVEHESGSPILVALLEAARDPNVDIAKFRELKAMRDEERDYHAERAYNRAMQAAQAKMGPVVRDRKNDQTNSKYATIEALAKAITPVYTEHGFAMSFGEGETTKPNHLRVTARLMHTGGHATDHYHDVPIDKTGIQGKINKTDTHATGSTMTYGRRYLKLLVWDIATEDDDGNAAAGGALISEEQIAALRQLIIDVDADLPKLLAYLKVEKLEDIFANKFDEVKRIIEQKRKQAAAKASAA